MHLTKKHIKYCKIVVQSSQLQVCFENRFTFSSINFYFYSIKTFKRVVYCEYHYDWVKNTSHNKAGKFSSELEIWNNKFEVANLSSLAVFGHCWGSLNFSIMGRKVGRWTHKLKCNNSKLYSVKAPRLLISMTYRYSVVRMYVLGCWLLTVDCLRVCEQ